MTRPGAGSPRPGYTIGRLGSLCGLSRSTLLYYDSIGLLSPSTRSASGYRLYSEADRERLERILVFRSLGLPLERIRSLLELEGGRPAGALLKRVFEINDEIGRLRRQQRAVLELIEADGTLKVGRAAIRALSELAQATGGSEANYESIHAAFEENAPAEHRRLLKALGFSETEIGAFVESLRKEP